MNNETYNFYFILILLGLLVIAFFVGYKHVEHIEIMRHSPCDLCIKCPNNIINELNLSIPKEFFTQNDTNIHSELG